jgi:DNA-directed RNA polymerase subunit RPC12/RpoP
MGQGVRFVCSRCHRAIEAWSDGNPYYIDENGRKRYAYHPDHENLARCVGNDSPYLCLACGGEFKVDSRAPIVKCPSCGASDIAETRHLTGRPCPYCNEGTFKVDPQWRPIS